MNVFVIAPHPDDEVLGCGGMIAKRVAAGDKVVVYIVTRGYAPLFDQALIEKGREEAVKANRLLGVKRLLFGSQPASELSTIPQHKLTEELLIAIQSEMPDEVYIPHRGDIHLDHKAVADAAMVALRPKYSHRVKRVYAYEVPSETGWDIPNEGNAFIPTVYEDITETAFLKLEALRIYESQEEPFPKARSIKAVEALARYRGTTVGVEAAEAFALIRELK